MPDKSQIIDPYYDREAKRYHAPIASREYILKLLSKTRGLNLDQIKKKLGYVDEKRINALRHRVSAMERDAQIVLTSTKKYLSVQKLKRIQGTFQRRRDTGASLSYQGKLIHVSGFSAHVAMDGDLVEAALFLGIHNVEKAVITAVKQRKAQAWIGQVISVAKDRAVAELFVLNQEYRTEFDIQNRSLKIGDFVRLGCKEVKKQQAAKLDFQLLEHFGSVLPPNEVGRMIAQQMNVEHCVNPKAEDELAALTEKQFDFQDRKDLTDLRFVTIDGEDAKDFDDAVLCQRVGEQFKLYVAIADVSSFVKANTQIDKQAYARATSVYFPGFVMPMLPDVLANDLCSLRPDCRRLTLTCEMTLTPTGTLESYKFYHAIIRSRKRYTYTEVNQLVLKGQTKADDEVESSVTCLHDLCQVMLQRRTERGALDFNSPMVSIGFAKDKVKPIAVDVTQRNIAHQMIEEAMLLANIAAARFLLSEYGEGIFRNHPRPDWEKFEALKVVLAKKGIVLGEQSGVPSPSQYLQLLSEIQGREDERLLETLILRSLPRALYEDENLGHFGLAFDEYTHFTSPIRRYPDLVVHRLISAKITKTKPSAVNLKSISEHCSMLERRAESAERASMLWYKCFLLQDNIGQSDYGIVTGVMPFGIFVLLEGTQAEGMVHISSLRGYVYHPNEYSLSHAQQNKVIQLGDRIKVKVTAVNLIERHVRLVLAK